MDRLDNDAKLALYTALDKKLNNKKDGLLTVIKSEETAKLMESARNGKADRKPLVIDGQKVGYIGVSYSKPGIGIREDAKHRALDYLLSIDAVDIRPSAGWQDNFIVHDDGSIVCKVTGDFVDDLFCTTKGEPKYAKVYDCEPEVVLRAVAPLLSSADAGIIGMLGSGEAE